MLRIDMVIELLIAVAAVGAIASKFNLSLPILLMLTGMGFSFVPGIASFQLNPDLIFIFFLPPLLYFSAWFVSWRDIRYNMRIILFLAIGLVLVTTLVIGFAGHYWIAGLSLPAAFVLGSIVSPTDAIAATAIIKQFKLPKRIVNILDEESLLNDSTALVVYSFAVGAIVKDDHFHFFTFGGQFLILGIGGVLLGLSVAHVVAWIWKHIHDTQIGITFSFLVPYAAYLPAQALGVSGVLSVVAAGIYLGWRSPQLLSSTGRVKGQTVWETINFLLNGFIFLITGLQLRDILAHLSAYSWQTLAWDAVLISTMVVVIRLIYTYLMAYIPRMIVPGLAERDPYPSWQTIFVIAWSGMRGVVSLAAAFALPFLYDGEKPFPNRDLILFLTFAVILFTLIFQGLSLPWIVRWFNFKPETKAQCDELEARFRATNAAIAKIEELVDSSRIAPDTKTVTRMRAFYDERLNHLEHQKKHHKNGKEKDGSVRRPFRDIELEVVGAERETIISLRNEGAINDETMRLLEREIDLQEIRILN